MRNRDVTPRQVEVMQMVANDYATAEIGRRLGVGARTVQVHIQSVLYRTHTHSRAAAVACLMRQGKVR